MPHRRVARRIARAKRCAFVAGLVAAAGCAELPPEPEPLRPVRSETVEVTSAGRARTFSGTARAGRETDLSFRVPGTIERLDVEVGDSVRAGQVLSQLERDDYEIAVRQAEANLNQALASSRNADADLERIRSLWENNNASQNDLDQALAASQSARAQVDAAEQALAQARRRLGYTALRAPVDGSVAEVPVEVGENVQPGARAVRMTSGEVPEVEVAIPEVLISRIRDDAPVTVSFAALPGETFDAVVTEVGVASTGTATTFPVTARLLRPNPGVRSGMAAEVTFLFGDDDRPRIFLPAYAIGEDRQGRFVFILEDTDEPGVGRVHRTAVTTGAELTPDGRLEVRSGVTAGQRVVTAGVRRLRDGQRVKLLGPEEPT